MVAWRAIMAGVLVWSAGVGAASVGASPRVGYFPERLRHQALPCRGAQRQVVLDDFEAEWFGKHLAAAGERSLAVGPGTPRTVRFTWLRSFHHPVTVRLEWLASGRVRMAARLLSGSGGYEPGVVARRVNRDLTRAEQAAVDGLITRSGLFGQPAAGCDLGNDGAEWVFEERDGNAYRFIKRWSPESGPARDVGLAMLGLTGWSLGDIY